MPTCKEYSVAAFVAKRRPPEHLRVSLRLLFPVRFDAGEPQIR